MTAHRTADLPLHDPTGPSTLGRLLACPGSLRRVLAEPDIRSEWAEEGEAKHEALAQALRGEPLPEDLGAEDRARIEACLAFLDEKIAGREELGRWVEAPVSLLEGVNLVNYGTTDLIVLLAALSIPREELLVVDWKFGRKVHQHALVLQLANYAAAAASSIPELAELAPLPVSAYAYFPVFDESYVWRSQDIHAECPRVAGKVKEIIALAHQIDAPLNPGPHCDYCNHLPNCEAVRAETALVEAHFQAGLPADPKKIVALYDAATLAEKQSKAVKQRIKELLDEDPQAIPGLEYAEVNGIRSVADIGGFVEALVGAGHVDAARFEAECVEQLVKITKAEELFLQTHYKGRGAGLPTKDSLKKKFADITKGTVKQPTQKRLRRVSAE